MARSMRNMRTSCSRFLIVQCNNMFTKRTDTLADVPPEKRFRRERLDLAIGNERSAARTARLAQSAVWAGAGHVKDLAKDPDEAQNNLARDLLRKAVRHSRWPGLYLADIPMMNPANNKAYVTKLSFLLPHESIRALLKVNRAQDLQSGLTPQFFQQRPDLQECWRRAGAKFDLRDPLLLGLWADSVPFNSDRSQSLECLTLSVLGLKDFRLPICCFQNATCTSRRHTTVFSTSLPGPCNACSPTFCPRWKCFRSK